MVGVLLDRVEPSAGHVATLEGVRALDVVPAQVEPPAPSAPVGRWSISSQHDWPDVAEPQVAGGASVPMRNGLRTPSSQISGAASGSSTKGLSGGMR